MDEQINSLQLQNTDENTNTNKKRKRVRKFRKKNMGKKMKNT